MKFSTTTKRILVSVYFILYVTIALTLLIRQPFGNPPDEYNRYLIPSYIAEHGTLPNGFQEEIRIGGYGFSYAFQPILPYMFQGYAMGFVALFNDSAIALLYTARGVNFLFGLLTALLVLLLSQKWFSDDRSGYLFAFFATFLPQSIFVHTYVNTDSCCMLSIAIMLYALTLGFENDFSLRTCALLALGIILCALSYYNAYGYILSCIVLFIGYFLTRQSNRFVFDYTSLFKKGLLISCLVLLGISWWFVRSYLLYDGDFLGLRTRNFCASLYAAPPYHPQTRITYQNQGYSLWYMLAHSDFCNLSLLSFIGIYGPMTIITSIWVYRFYKAILFVGLLLCACLQTKKISFADRLLENRPAFRIFYHANMIFCILMPCFLSAWYSYSTDYQPQGRYLLPILLPVCYYVVRGFYKGHLWISGFSQKKKPAFFTGLFFVLLLMIIASILITVYGYALPNYLSEELL